MDLAQAESSEAPLRRASRATSPGGGGGDRLHRTIECSYGSRATDKDLKARRSFEASRLLPRPRGRRQPAGLTEGGHRTLRPTGSLR